MPAISPSCIHAVACEAWAMPEEPSAAPQDPSTARPTDAPYRPTPAASAAIAAGLSVVSSCTAFDVSLRLPDSAALYRPWARATRSARRPHSSPMRRSIVPMSLQASTARVMRCVSAAEAAAAPPAASTAGSRASTSIWRVDSAKAVRVHASAHAVSVLRAASSRAQAAR